MDMSHLNTKTPLGDKIDRIGEFVNVRRFEGLMVCGHADVPLEVILEWSPDGLEKAMESVLNVPADQWKSQKFDVLMPFVRLHLINKSSGRPKPNKDLSVVTTPQGGAAYAVHEPAAAEPEKRSKSPIRRFIDNIPSGKQSKKDHRPTSSYNGGSSASGRDERIPEYIPENVILIGGKSGRVQLLPRGNPGEVLSVNSDGKLIWASISSLLPPSGSPSASPSTIPSSGSTGSLISSSARASMLQSSSFESKSKSSAKLSFSSIPPPTNPAPELPPLSPLLEARLPSRLNIDKLGSVDPVN